MRLLIVDDEQMIRDGMADVLRQRTPEHEIYTARDGMEALKLLESQTIDAMFLDVCMPKMDGMELLRQMKDRGIQNVLTVIISGYNDFEYAKAAVEERVYEYILKPVTPNETYEVMLRVQKEVERRQKEQNEVDNLRRLVAGSREQLQLQLFQDILAREYEPADILERGQLLQMRLAGDRYCCAGITVATKCETSIVSSQTRMIAARGYWEKLQRETGLFHLLQIHSDTLILLFVMDAGHTHSKVELLDLLDTWVAGMTEQHDLSATAAISNIYPDLSDLPTCYEEVVSTLRYKAVMKAAAVYATSDFVGNDQTSSWVPDDTVSMWLKTGNVSALQNAIRRTLSVQVADENMAVLVHLSCNEIAISICKVLARCNVDIQDMFAADRITLQIPLYLHDLQQITEWLCQLAEQAAAKIGMQKVADTGHLITKVKQYVGQNFARPINNALIADAFGYSPNYLGQIFREATGVTLNDYLRNIRIERAKQLLQDTTLKIVDIALQVGFSDNQYFTTVFRKKVGVTPKEYREYMSKINPS